MKTHIAKKSLGQNFLKSEPALREIVKAGEVKKDDVILEIGPGKGALTKKLLEVAGKVIAVEKDNNLFELLNQKFAKEISEGKLILLNEDVLEFKIKNVLNAKFLSGPRIPGSLPQPDHEKTFIHPFFKIIANIPYNITGAILKKFLTEENQPERMILMVQHEVAKRIVASDKKESILSISVKAYGEPKLIMKVPARYFAPAPKVDSAVIAIKNISRERFTSPTHPLLSGEGGQRPGEVLESKFWEVVKQGFAHKRKKLSGNLKSLVKNGTIASLENFGDKRAEDLTLEDWFSLIKS